MLTLLIPPHSLIPVLTSSGVCLFQCVSISLSFQGNEISSFWSLHAAHTHYSFITHAHYPPGPNGFIAAVHHMPFIPPLYPPSCHCQCGVCYMACICYSMRTGLYHFCCTLGPIIFWLATYVHYLCHLLHRHLPIHSLVTFSFLHTLTFTIFLLWTLFS